MNNEAYCQLDEEKIITKYHYCFDNNDKLFLLPLNHPYIGYKVGYLSVYEKISLEDFRPLNDNEIVNEEHFYVWRDSYGNLVMHRCYSSHQGSKTSDVRKKYNSIPEFNLYAKKTQFNFETLNILKEIEL
jgi:hypothetical protein